MRGTAKGVTVALVLLALSACTPFFYGEIVVFGPDKDQPQAEGTAG